jgi:hypothetical protein
VPPKSAIRAFSLWQLKHEQEHTTA